MMDPVTVMLFGAAPAVLRVADALAQRVLLRARADLARAKAVRVSADRAAGGAQ